MMQCAVHHHVREQRSCMHSAHTLQGAVCVCLLVSTSVRLEDEVGVWWRCSCCQRAAARLFGGSTGGGKG